MAMADFAAGNKLLASELNALPRVIDRVSNSASGTITSGTTDTMDIVLGTVSCVADGSTYYRIELLNLQASSSVANDHYVITIKDGGASTPTTLSTEIARTLWRDQASGGPGQEGFYVGNTVLLSAGTHTFGMFAQRDAGTGIFSPIGNRTLLVSTAGSV
jgi:hypothetical protein